MSKIIITKGKLLKGDKIEVEYTKQESNTSKPAQCSEQHSDPPHDDLKKAFAALSIHAALLGEFVATTAVKDIQNPEAKLFKDFTVTGFTITGADDDEGVILTAHKTLKSGKTLGFNTPVTRFEDSGNTAYAFSNKLSDAIDECKDRLRDYLNGTFAPDPQSSLQF